jgi:ribosomal 30S subunit maturation factor RimM
MSNDNYIVLNQTGEVLIPVIDEVIGSIDLDNGTITFKDELLKLNEKAADISAA